MLYFLSAQHWTTPLGLRTSGLTIKYQNFCSFLRMLVSWHSNETNKIYCFSLSSVSALHLHASTPFFSFFFFFSSLSVPACWQHWWYEIKMFLFCSSCWLVQRSPEKIAFFFFVSAGVVPPCFVCCSAMFYNFFCIWCISFALFSFAASPKERTRFHFVIFFPFVCFCFCFPFPLLWFFFSHVSTPSLFLFCFFFPYAMQGKGKGNSIP